MNKLLVTRGLEQLGPERVRQAVARRYSSWQSWHGCFLAQCYGANGQLHARLEKLCDYTEHTVAVQLGIGYDEAYEISRAHTNEQDQLYALAQEWLEDVTVHHQEVSRVNANA